MCGLPLPDVIYGTKRNRLIFSYYNILIAAFLSWKTVCTTLSVMSSNFEDRMIAESILMLLLTGLSLTCIYKGWTEGLKRLIDNADKICENVSRNDFGAERSFEHTYKQDSHMLRLLNKAMCTSTLACPFLYCISTPIVEYLSGDYGRSYAIPVSCSFENVPPGGYEIFLFLQFCCLFIPALQKLGNEFIMFGLVKIQSAYFKYLAKCLLKLANDMPHKPKAETKRKLLKWTSMHQQALRNVQEIQDYFSSVVIVYYISMISIVTCGVFYQINAEKTNIVQTGTLGTYMSITIFQFYLLCHLADELSEEGEKVAREAYCIPWYLLDSDGRGYIRLIINMGNRPLTMMAYRSPAFMVSREAFQAFIVNLVSAYMGFSKIKDVE